MTRKTLIGLILATLLPLIILIYPGDLGLMPRLALALSAFTVVFWTFEPVPIEYSSLLVLLLFPLLGVLPFELAFNAFSGKAVWLIFSGMALSLGITETPLGARLARMALGRVNHYGRLILGLHILGLVSAFLIPSGVVRILILMPILISLLRTLDEKPGSRASTALILSLVCSTYYGGTGVLTASVPNLVVFGALESHGQTVYWGEWAGYMFPVLGLVRVACGYLLIRLILPISHTPDVSSLLEDNSIPSRLTSAEKKTIGILLLGILLWATDALHGVHPAYIGLALVLLCYLPGWGPLHPEKLKQVNFPILIYIAAAFAMGHALEHTGLNARLAGLLTPWMDLPPDN
ncbi:MAG: SLC13 family permease, partial [bacterium]|nr:SLC13 family permease [bacterium]